MEIFKPQTKGKELPSSLPSPNPQSSRRKRSG